MTLPTRNLRECKRCHVEVVTPAANLDYCQECRKVTKPERQAAANRRWRAKGKARKVIGRLAHGVN